MALVVFLKGVNVGGHRRFRPTALARALQHLQVQNVGAAGTFVVHGRISRADLRAEIARRLPFDADIVICPGREVTSLLAQEFFAGYPPAPDVVRFVGALARLPRSEPELPLELPSGGGWLVKVLARHGPFVVGLHRRRMKAIGELGRLEKILGVPATIRSWTTMARIGRAL